MLGDFLPPPDIGAAALSAAAEVAPDTPHGPLAGPDSLPAYNSTEGSEEVPDMTAPSERVPHTPATGELAGVEALDDSGITASASGKASDFGDNPPPDPTERKPEFEGLIPSDRPVSYHDEVVRAIEYAPRIVLPQEGEPLDAGINRGDKIIGSNSTNDIPVHRMRDDEILPANIRWRDPLNSVRAATEEDLARLLDATTDVLGIEGFDVEGTVNHESEHAEVWRAFGLPVHFEVRMMKAALTEADFEAEKFGVGFQPITLGVNVHVPRLFLGAQAVYPREPSEGDIASLKLWGYTGVQDVGKRIEAYNQAQHTAGRLLLPKSYVSPPPNS